jgi:hypothetical protein
VKRCFLDNMSLQWAFDKDSMSDYAKPGSKPKSEEERKTYLSYCFKSHAPRWEFGSSALQGFVNPWAKPGKVIEEIINRFSVEDDTILDFFSGGQVMKHFFIMKRECFVYSDSKRDFEFLKLYVSNLKQALPSVRRFFSNFEVKHKDYASVPNCAEARKDVSEQSKILERFLGRH